VRAPALASWPLAQSIMALRALHRTLAGALTCGHAGHTGVAGAWTQGLDRCLHATPSPRKEPEAPAPDPFTAALQEKTQEQLVQLLAQHRGQREEGGQPGDDDDDDDAGAQVNPDTGEVGGYQGKEATRFGDWEHKGRCTDFS